MSEIKSIPFSEGKCYLHSVHVPRPAELHYHHVYPLWMQKKLGLDGPGETVLVCPTGHNNIHNLIDRLLEGDIPLGRRGVTGRLALHAFEWFKDNNYGQGTA